MKTMKRLQVAAAAASLFALAGAAQAAILNTTGSVVAVEVIQPAGTPTGAGLSNLSNVRAPAFTYSYEGGITVQAQSVQHFQIVTTIGGVGDYAFTNITDPLVPGFGQDPVQAAKTIAAQLRGVGNDGRRVGVIGAAPGAAIAAVGATNVQGGAAGAFGIVLTEVRRGDHVVGSPTFDPNTNSTKSVTYFFQLVNNTTSPVTLSGLDLTFQTSKTNVGVPPTAYVTNSIADSATDISAQYGSIFNLAPLSVPAIGHQVAGANVCGPSPGGVVTLRVISGEGVNPAIGPEPNNTAVGGESSTFSRNYLAAQRAIDVIVSPGVNRQIQVTNSFQTNVGSSPTNGIGGTGGGRFSFKPTGVAITNVYGGLGAGGSINHATGHIQLDNTVAGRNVNDTGRGNEPTTRSDGNDRAARLATLSFNNRTSALDRLLDVDAYQFRAQTDAGAPSNGFPGFPATDPRPVGPTKAYGDFTVVTPPTANVFGGVDVPTTAGAPAALTLTFQSKADFRGFAGGTAAGFGAGTMWLVRGGASAVNGGCGLAVGDIPLVSRIQATSGAGGNFAQVGAGTGNYVWNISGAALQAASGTNTLQGDWHVCYYVPGTIEIPNTFFRNAVATLNKDDASEQANISCPSPMAYIDGGVKVDVRQFQAVTSDDSWSSFVRVINNSETEVATVEAQYIWDSGLYGKWGTLGTLNQRASRIFSSAEIAGLLTTDPITLSAAQINTAIPRDVKLRLRIAADTSTIRVQNFFFNRANGALVEASGAQGADFVNVDSSNRDHIDQDAQTGIVK